MCVVGIGDDYSGEVPLAFVMLEGNAARKVQSSSKAAEEVKQSIMKVSETYFNPEVPSEVCHSMSLTLKFRTNG